MLSRLYACIPKHYMATNPDILLFVNSRTARAKGAVEGRGEELEDGVNQLAMAGGTDTKTPGSATG
jgi:hypothetical protein